jgi:hypothetical protein
MKLSLPCPSCLEDERNSGNRNTPQSTPLGNNYADITESWELTFTCFFGHEIKFELHQHKFQILFEMGLQALVEGYCREAVSNIASAIERFYEFSILVFCKRLGLDKETFESAWKDMKKHSERQLGAYHMLYVSCLKHPTNYIKNDIVNFRNKIIHNGYIPSYEEALKYTEEVFLYLSNKITELREYFKLEIGFIMNKMTRGEPLPRLISLTLLKVDGDFEQKVYLHDLHRHLEYIVNNPPFLKRNSSKEMESIAYKDAYSEQQRL